MTEHAYRLANRSVERNWDVGNFGAICGNRQPQLVALRLWKRALNKALAANLDACPVLTEATVIIKSLCFDNLKPTIKDTGSRLLRKCQQIIVTSHRARSTRSLAAPSAYHPVRLLRLTRGHCSNILSRHSTGAPRR